MNRFASRLTALVVIGAAVAGCPEPLFAQRIEDLGQGRAVREVYAPVVQRANRSVVEVVVDGEARVLGTVVAPDLVVTKFSELQRRSDLAEGDSAGAPEWTCRQGERSWACTQLAFDRAADLVLLRVTGARLTPVEWQAVVPAPGAFLATPDMSRLPLGVGILSAAPYRHTRQRAFLGVRFADPNSGPVELDEVIEHGAAEAAGLQGGDVVVGFAGQAIDSPQALRTQLGKRKPGDKVQVKVRRGDAELSYEVTLGTNTSVPLGGQERIWGPLSEVRSGFHEVLQHDTVLEPDDCGGPVVDLSGEVVGVNIARAGRVETLALPAAAVQKIVERLLRSREKRARAATGK